MCLTVPRRVEKVVGDKAWLQDGRLVKTVLVGDLKPGDVVLVQADLVIEKISRKQAREMKQVMIQDS